VADKLVPLNLTCRAAAAKPAATLTWLRNDVELALDNVRVAYSTAKSTVVGGKLHDAESVLTFTPTDDDNEAVYTCAAQNEALQRPHTVNVQLAVLREFSRCYFDVFSVYSGLRLVVFQTGCGALRWVP